MWKEEGKHVTFPAKTSNIKVDEMKQDILGVSLHTDEKLDPQTIAWGAEVLWYTCQLYFDIN